MFTERATKGFTLIEFIMVITITGILAAAISTFISQPILGYTTNATRSALVNAAELALRRMGRDIQRAVPNSPRVSGTTVFELMYTVETIRYRAVGPSHLNFNVATSGFDVIGTFLYAGVGTPGYYMIIYNTGAVTGGGAPVAGSNVYATPTKAAGTIPPTPPPAGSSVTTDAGAGSITTTSHVAVSPAMQFAFPSPQQRLYVSNGPVTYLCDLTAGTIVRYTGYTISATQLTTAAALTGAGATAATLVSNVTACSFTYSPGTTQRNATANLRIALTQGGETVTLMHQVNIRNVP